MEIFFKNGVLIKLQNDSVYTLYRSDLNQNLLDVSLNHVESKIFRKKISLNGLGYKCQVINSSLSFKLNLSHSLDIAIPSYIVKVIQKKNTLIFESFDKIMLGNFVENLYNLRPADVYKSKGFYLESKNNITKEVNKKNKKS